MKWHVESRDVRAILVSGALLWVLWVGLFQVFPQFAAGRVVGSDVFFQFGSRDAAAFVLCLVVAIVLALIQSTNRVSDVGGAVLRGALLGLAGAAVTFATAMPDLVYAVLRGVTLLVAVALTSAVLFALRSGKAPTALRMRK